MLKFGREIDLDDLEKASNRSREHEAERQLQLQEKRNEEIIIKLVREGESLKEELAQITTANTDLLTSVGDLTQQRLEITRDLNASGKYVSTESKDEGSREREERAEGNCYVQLQAREIEALRAELIMLKRKEAPQLSQKNRPTTIHAPADPWTGILGGHQPGVRGRAAAHSGRAIKRPPNQLYQRK